MSIGTVTVVADTARDPDLTAAFVMAGGQQPPADGYGLLAASRVITYPLVALARKLGIQSYRDPLPTGIYVSADGREAFNYIELMDALTERLGENT